MKVLSSIINRNSISPTNRLDSEYFDPRYVSFEEKIKEKSSTILSDIYEESKSKINPNNKASEFFKYLEITDISLMDGSYCPQSIIGEEAPSRARKVCKNNELIISTVRPNRNAIAIISGKKNLVCSTGFCVLRSKGIIEPELLFIFLKSKYAKLQLTRRMRATMYPAVANIDILEIKVPPLSKRLRELILGQIPSVYSLREESDSKLEAINRIVNDFCDLILQNINIGKYYSQNNFKTILRSQLIKNSANRIDAEFYSILFDKIDELFVKYKEYKPLKCFYNKIFTGKTPAKGDYREPEEESVPIIKVGTLTNSGINWSKVEYTSLDFFRLNKRASVKKNDILFISSAHSVEHICNKVDVINNFPEDYEGRCLFVGELMVLRNDNSQKIEPYYMASFLRSNLGKLQAQRCARGISSHVYNDIGDYIKVPIPSQSRIDEITKLAKDAEERKHKAESIIRFLIDELEKEVGINFN